MKVASHRRALVVETWPLERLRPYERNPRIHSKEQVEQIARSIREFGFTNPILSDRNGVIIAGHGRLSAARRLGLSEVPVIVLEHLSDAQRRALLLADNQLALSASWDEALLKAELEALRDEDLDLSMIGFTDEELASILDQETDAGDGAAEGEAAPEPPANPVTRPGDLFLLGAHRLICGDSTSPGCWERLLEGSRAQVCLTDPPYGVGLGYVGFEDTSANVAALAERWLPLARQHAECVVFSCGVTRQWLYPEPSWVLGWFFASGALSSSWGFSCWQPFLCYGKDPSLASGKGRRPDAFDLNVAAHAGDIAHPCPKPVALWITLIDRLSFEPSDIIVDCFGGSGTTVIACEERGRAARVIELSPAYCDVIVRRWEAHAGESARLEGDGRTFAEVAQERGV